MSRSKIGQMSSVKEVEFDALIHFSFVMIMGHMSFLRPEWLHRLGAWWKRRMGVMEMIYDGRCGFCVRSMACG